MSKPSGDPPGLVQRKVTTDHMNGLSDEQGMAPLGFDIFRCGSARPENDDNAIRVLDRPAYLVQKSPASVRHRPDVKPDFEPLLSEERSDKLKEVHGSDLGP